MNTPWRRRIVEHVQVRAGDLVPHPMNPRIHPDVQKTTLLAALNRLGLARSVLARRLPDGQLQILDGHLRASLDPHAILDVEVVDVGDTEAQELLLTLDPLSGLAVTDAETAARLLELCPVDDPHLKALWEQLACKEADLPLQEPEGKEDAWATQHQVLVTCAGEEAQRALMEELGRRGFDCRALTS